MLRVAERTVKGLLLVVQSLRILDSSIVAPTYTIRFDVCRRLLLTAPQ